MNKLFLLTAFRRTFGDAYREPDVHFHAASYEDSPEICYEGACQRPQLTP